MFARATFQPAGWVRRPQPLATLHASSRNALGGTRDVVRGAALATTDVLEGAAKALLTLTCVVGAAIELAWASTHLAL